MSAPTNPKRKALGKGLAALLPEPEEELRKDSTTEVGVGQLEPNPLQPRTVMNPARLQELAASIRESGIVQPILVRQTAAGYQIIAGERRWRAAQQAGLATVPVIVREVADDRLLELALVENIQREELGPLEEAQAFQRLQQDLGLTQEEVARKVGRDRSTVANSLRLLRLPKEARELLAAGRLEAGHGRALLAVEHAEDLVGLARETARKGLSVREVERRVALLRTPKARKESRKDANTRAAEERLHAALGARVEIQRRGRAGTMRIAFTGEADLNRLFELLLRVGRSR
jgi:ParB family transcriptional regulator, chromosome partitioning protein